MKNKKVKKRIVWGFNPVSRVVLSKKYYSRNRQKTELQKIRSKNV
jgi:pullulanase/glycogen debranching enzyme